MSDPKPTSSKEKKSLSSKSSSRGSVAHYNAILIEDLKSQFKAVIEHVDGSYKSLEQKMNDGFREVHARLDIHEDYLKENTKRWQENDKRWQEQDKRWQENDKRWQENEKLWKANGDWQGEMFKLLSHMDKRLDRIDSKLDNHEERITVLEDRLPGSVY